MALEDVVNVTITLETAAVDVAAFNIPLVAAYHTNWTDRVRTYSASSALETLVSEGFSTSSPAYKSFQKILSANPRVRTLMLGRRDTAWTQITRITPVAANTTVYSVSVNGTTVSFTSDGSATLAEVCTGLAAAIDALPLVTASGASGTYVDVTTTAPATLATVKSVAPSTSTVTDVTVDASSVADMTAIRLADTSWYAFTLDSNADAENLAVAAWAETQKVVFFAQTSDTAVLSPGSTTDIGYVLHGLDYARTALIYTEDQQAFADARWVGAILPKPPGSYTAAFKSLSGVTPSILTETAQAALKAKGVNFYVTVGGAPITKHGVMVGGEFIDITIFSDWLIARITERVFALLVNSDKLPFSDTSVNLVSAEIYAVLREGIAVGGLLAGGNGVPEPLVTAPLVADVPEADRLARNLPDIHFSARLAGAIHSVLDIQGTLSV